MLQDWDPRLLEQSIERSLRHLKTDWLDLVQLHSCSEQVLRDGKVIEVLQRAKKAGKTRYIGYSGDGQAALYAVQCGQFDALETSVNIADQEALDLTLPIAQSAGIGVIAKRPIAHVVWKFSGRPGPPTSAAYWDRLRELGYDFLTDEENDIPTALRFALSVPGVHTAIVGSTRHENWRKDVEIASVPVLQKASFEAIRARWKAVARPDWTGKE